MSVPLNGNSLSPWAVLAPAPLRRPGGCVRSHLRTHDRVESLCELGVLRDR